MKRKTHVIMHTLPPDSIHAGYGMVWGAVQKLALHGTHSTSSIPKASTPGARISLSGPVVTRGARRKTIDTIRSQTSPDLQRRPQWKELVDTVLSLVSDGTPPVAKECLRRVAFTGSLRTRSDGIQIERTRNSWDKTRGALTKEADTLGFTLATFDSSQLGSISWWLTALAPGRLGSLHCAFHISFRTLFFRPQLRPKPRGNFDENARHFELSTQGLYP